MDGPRGPHPEGESLWASSRTRALTAGLAISMPALAAPAHGADYVSVENVTAAAQVYISDCPDEVASPTRRRLR